MHVLSNYTPSGQYHRIYSQLSYTAHLHILGGHVCMPMCTYLYVCAGGELFTLLEREGVFLEDAARYACVCVSLTLRVGRIFRIVHVQLKSR